MLPGAGIPALVAQPLRQGRGKGERWPLDNEVLAEIPGAVAGLVGELPEEVAIGVVGAAAGSQVPMQEEQGGQALLSVEGNHAPVLDLSVNEVQAHRLATGQGLMQHAEEGLANARHATVLPTLGIVALDHGNLDAIDNSPAKDVSE